MRIVADRGRCEGHGMCEALAPQWLRVGDDDLVESHLNALPEAERDLAALVVDSCPVQALRLD